MCDRSVIDVVNLSTVDVKQWIKNPLNVYIGRATKTLPESKWANPYPITDEDTREVVVEKFVQYFRDNRELLKDLYQLKGKTLGCWCTPERCHGHIIKEFLERQQQQQQQTDVTTMAEPMQTTQPSFSAVASRVQDDKVVKHEYVEIDATACNDPYNLPKSADICLALTRTYGADPDRTVFGASRGRLGIYHLESPDIERYRAVREIRIEDGDPPLALTTIRNEQISVKNDGRITRQPIKNPNDLLITLQDADKHLLQAIPNEDILKAIVEMDVGEIKKSVQRQWNWDKGEYTGNKFFVLQNVKPEERDKIPRFFLLNHPVVGKVKMWLNHKHLIRRCWYCGEQHAAVCEIREKIEALKVQREQKKASLAGCFQSKTYTTSVFRYANQNSLASDVDAMSGATTGNLLNAVEVDTNSKNVPSIVLVSGSNEKSLSNVSLEEYAFSLKVIRERLKGLLEKKKIFLVPPPSTLQPSPEEAVKQEFFEQHIQRIEEAGVKIIKNPVEEYDEDLGKHPSPAQTTEIIKAVDDACKLELASPYILENVTEDIISLSNKYQHVKSLYKYGCGACSRKDRNKWQNICDVCKQQAAEDEEVKHQAQEMRKRIAERTENELPPLGDPGDSSDDVLKCETCDLTFSNITDIRAHFNDNHPDMKFKRGKTQNANNVQDTEKKGRRNKSTPYKSL